MTDFKFNPNGTIVTVPKFIPAIGIQQPKTERQPFFGTPDVGEQNPDRQSYFGTPVFSNLEIPAGKYKTLDGNVIEFDGIRVDAVLFNVTQTKNIIKTPIQGRNGTIKEYISDGDYFISADGVIVGETDQSGRNFTVKAGDGIFPENDFRKLVEILKCPEPIEIVSEFLDFFEIRNVVIESAAFDQTSGDRSRQVFSLKMISDTPIELVDL